APPRAGPPPPPPPPPPPAAPPPRPPPIREPEPDDPAVDVAPVGDPGHDLLTEVAALVEGVDAGEGRLEEQGRGVDVDPVPDHPGLDPEDVPRLAPHGLGPACAQALPQSWQILGIGP